jgi:hypothetical protein
MAPPQRKPQRHSLADLRRKAVIGAIVTLTTALLLLSLGLAVGRVWVTVVAVACAVGAAVALRRRAIPDCPRPTAGEIALAAATATYVIAAVTFMWWALYWLIHWALSLLDSVASIGIDEDAIAWFATLVLIAPTLVISAGRAAYEMEAELYPATGLRSRYRDVIRFRGRTLMWRTVALVVGLVAFIGLAIAFDIARETVGTWLLVIFALAGAVFAVPAGAQRLGSVRAPDVKRVAEAAQAVGWQVLPNPQTGDPGLDPYLAEVDLFASKDALSMLVKVVQGAPGGVPEGKLDPIGWPVVATVLTAARTLPPDQVPKDVRTVEPVLVLIDTELQSEPLLFASENGVGLLSVDARATFALAPDVPRLEQELQAIGEAFQALRAQAPTATPGAAA